MYMFLPKIKITSNISTTTAINKTDSKTYPVCDFTLKFDGCSKGNPGISGAGAVIYHHDEEVWHSSFFVGERFTNNHAEYSGLLLGLKHAIELDIKEITVYGDSLLVINQMTNKYKCNSSNLIELYDNAKALCKKFVSINFIHILRQYNKRADQLANIAVDKYLEEKRCL